MVGVVCVAAARPVAAGTVVGVTACVFVAGGDATVTLVAGTTVEAGTTVAAPPLPPHAASISVAAMMAILVRNVG
ncbi:MAG: hypothetical protein LC793_10350 [Thermomicrobia bacterium]|nr:hypothetical protein [Thermomicrobia bacterium]